MLFKQLSLEHLDEIAALEASAWPLSLRASNEKLAQRLEWRHVMLGAFKAGKLVGIAAWRYGHFDPADAMPGSFDAFANYPNTTPHNAAFVYNFAIEPTLRNTKHGLELSLALISEGIKILIANDCTYLVGASRCPSYAGSKEPLSRCLPSTELRAVMDGEWQSHVDSVLPWQHDPVLSFYKHALDCTFHQILPAFMPEDQASGGHAIGFYKTLAES